MGALRAGSGVALTLAVAWAIALLPHGATRYRLCERDSPLLRVQGTRSDTGEYMGRSFGYLRFVVTGDAILGRELRRIVDRIQEGLPRRGFQLGPQPEFQPAIDVRCSRLEGWSRVAEEGTHFPFMHVISAYGWPFAAMRGDVIFETTSFRYDPIYPLVSSEGPLPYTTRGCAIVGASSIAAQSASEMRILPWHPLPVGFAIDTVLYAVVCRTIWIVPIRFRARLRRRSGRCQRCGYVLSTADRCPECGWYMERQRG